MEPDGINDEPDDLSVRLQWPEDPLSEPLGYILDEDEEEDDSPLAAHIDAIEQRIADVPGAAELAVDIVAALREVNASIRRFNNRATALRDEITAALAERDKEQQRSLARIEDALAVVETALKSVRRRMPIRAAATAGGDVPAGDALDELATRVADELEIRLNMTLKPDKSKRR